MIEVPRGALTADEIAEHAEFFSFGTNDLTQMTFGYSRDDAEGGFLLKYVEDGILPVNPFQTLDDAVAGLMKTAVDKGRATRPDLELGICGEHGGDPESIHKCERIGLDYVSCSPFRVPWRGWRPHRRSSRRPNATSNRRSRHLRGLRRGRRLTASSAGDAGRFRRLLLDTEPLRRDRDYRWLWSGQVVNGIGNQITRIALPYQVYVLTGSTLAIAALTLFQLVPILLFALGAGSLADAVDRRRLLMATQAGLAACSLILVVLALSGSPPVVALFAVAFLAAGLSAVDQPTRSSAIPRLVPAERLPSAIALNQLNFQMASIVGPAVGGILIATVGLAGAYGVDLVSFVASFIALLAIRPLPPIGVVTRPGLAAIREGLAYTRQRRAVLGSFVIDLNAMIFGMPTSLFPVLALDVFGTGPAGLGFLGAAPAVGAFLGAFLSGWVSIVRRAGRAVVIAVVIWGAAIAAFGLSTFSFALALVFLAIAGAADVLSAVFRSTIVQLETPDELRGRVTAIHIMAVTRGPPLRDIEAAAVAAAVGAQASVVSGGLLCIVGVAAVVRIFPELMRHETRLAKES